MSNIVVQIGEIKNRKGIMRTLHRLTGISYGEIARRINSHGVLVEHVLFLNDHAEVAFELRMLLKYVPPLAELKLYELHWGERFATYAGEIPFEQLQISAEMLTNLLDSADLQ